MKQLVLITCMLMITTFGWSQYDKEALQVLDEVSTKYKDMSFKAGFEFIAENKVAGTSDTFSGSVVVSGNKFWASNPQGIVVNDGEDVFTFLAEVEEVNIDKYYPEEEEIGFHNIFTVYKEGYKYALMEIQQNGNRVIELAQEKPTTFSKIRLIVTPGTSIDRFMVFNRDGGVFTYRLMDIEENADIPSDQFTLLKGSNQDQVLFEGELVSVEVVDFR